jgi:hypothetical protein
LVGLAEFDSHGWTAYVCAADNRWLAAVPDTPGVLRCSHCGYRTDTPGEGVLGDGFDIIHRQWGLRADPHAWWAMRELVATTPTPADASTIRVAYVDALRRVADVDIDTATEDVVYREHLNHGGMSGGSLQVSWWQTKGIPLLVDRALARRPAAHAFAPPTTEPRPTPAADASRRSAAGSIAVWAVVLAIPIALVGGGGWLLYQRAVGTPVEATVLECDASGSIVRGASTYSEDCIAEWTIDDRTVVGGFNGGNGASDVGKTVDATVRDDIAYSRSLGLPIVLIVLGAPFLVLPWLAWRSRRRRRAPDSPDSPAAIPVAPA